MNHKGFTLNELLVVIVIVGILIGIAVPISLSALNNARKKACNIKITEAEKSAVLWAHENVKCIVNQTASDCPVNNCGEGDTDCITNICEYNSGTNKSTCAIQMDTLARLNYISYDKYATVEQLNVGQVLNPIDKSNINKYMIELVFDANTGDIKVLNNNDKYTMCLLEAPENPVENNPPIIDPSGGNEPGGNNEGGNNEEGNNPGIIEEPPIPELKTWNNTTPGDGSLLGAIKRDNQVTPYASLPTTPGRTTSGENENIFSSAEDDDGTSYFFRGDGNLVKNWIKFGKDTSNRDIYWRIIRVNGDGSIRMIYNGPNTNQTGTTTSIAEAKFNSLSNNPKYSGYTYLGTANNLNTETNSVAKTRLETWYNSNFGVSSINELLAEYIVDGTYCNDKSQATINNGHTFYGPYKRLDSDKTPSYKCSIEKAGIIATTTTTNKYALKVGLITADEVAYAGGRCVNGNSGYWLYTNKYYWTFSPASGDDSVAALFCVSSDGEIRSTIASNSNYLRPVINLSSSTPVSEGNGSASNPYVVSVN